MLSSFFLINVYGQNNIPEMRRVWGEISEVMVANSDRIFLLGGDFNAILRSLDKRGGLGWLN